MGLLRGLRRLVPRKAAGKIKRSLSFRGRSKSFKRSNSFKRPQGQFSNCCNANGPGPYGQSQADMMEMAYRAGAVGPDGKVDDKWWSALPRPGPETTRGPGTSDDAQVPAYLAEARARVDARQNESRKGRGRGGRGGADRNGDADNDLRERRSVGRKGGCVFCCNDLCGCGETLRRCGLKIPVVISSTLVMMLGFVSLVLACVALTSDDIVSVLIPDEFAQWQLGVSLVMMLVAFAGFCATVSRKKRRESCCSSKCWLLFNALGTVLLLCLSFAGTVVFFVSSKLLRDGQKNHFASASIFYERLLFRSVRDVFLHIYDWCDPTAYENDAVNSACKELAPEEDSKCTNNTAGLLGVFCKAPEETQQHLLDVALYNPPPEEADAGVFAKGLLDFEFDWWLTTTCMPEADEFEAELAAATGTGPWQWDPLSTLGDESSSGYFAAKIGALERADEFSAWAECYNSTWWGDARPVAPGGIMSELGGESAANAQIVLQLGEGKGLSPKMLFCLCATRSSDMVDGAVAFFDTARFWALGGTLFFTLTLVSTWCLLCPDSCNEKRNKRMEPEWSSRGRRAL